MFALFLGNKICLINYSFSFVVPSFAHPYLVSSTILLLCLHFGITEIDKVKNIFLHIESHTWALMNSLYSLIRARTQIWRKFSYFYEVIFFSNMLTTRYIFNWSKSFPSVCAYYSNKADLLPCSRQKTSCRRIPIECCLNTSWGSRGHCRNSMFQNGTHHPDYIGLD